MERHFKTLLIDRSQKQFQLTREGQRVYDAAKARDPRLAGLREFAGTIDGVNVITFNCADGSLKSPFDRSHLDHTHGSFWRSRAGNDHTGILQVLLGKDDDMAFLDDPNARALAYREHCWANMEDSVKTPQGETFAHKGVTAVKQLRTHLTEIDAALATLDVKVAALSTGAGQTPEALKGMFLEVLNSTEGQAAITRAANTAEDS